MIGDTDPEDAYDATDPLEVRVAVLALIVAGIREDPDDVRRAARRRDALRVVDDLFAALATLGNMFDALSDELEAIV